MSSRITLLLLLGMIFSPAVQSQFNVIAPDQELRYIRQAAENQMEYIGLSATDRFYYSLPQPPNCWRISPSGTYIALSSSENPTSLIVRNIKTSDVILQTDWQSNWRPCFMYWYSDTIWGVVRSDDINAGLTYEIVSGTLIPYEAVLPGQPAPLPELPEQFQLMYTPEDIVVLRSPQPNVFAYYRCIGQTFPDGWQQCPGDVYAVVYDSASQIFLAQLDSDPHMFGFDITVEIPTGAVKAAWSADGRYLAYARTTHSLIKNFDLAIRDLTTNQDLDLDFSNDTVEYDVALTWSPVGHKLLFWLWGRLGEGYIGDDREILRHPIIFDADQQQFVWTENPYEFPPNYLGDPVQWSPDGLAFVFTDAAKNLIHVNALTGAAALLDTNVTTIIDWVEVQQIPPTPVPTLPPPTPVPTVAPTATPSAKAVIARKGTVESVDWSKDGTKLALGHDTGLVEIFSASTGQPLRNFQVTPVAAGVIIDLAWHPQSSDILAVASSQSGYIGGIDILNTATGQEILFLSNSWEEPVIRIAWKPDGSRIAGAIGSDGPPSFSRYIVIWDTATGQEVSRIRTDSDTIVSIDWSPDGTRIAAGLGENNILIWDANTGAVVNMLSGHTGAAYSVVWSPDGTKLATASDVTDRTIRIWDTTSGQNLLTIPDSGAFSITWSPDGTRMAAANIIDGIHIWDSSTGSLIESVPWAASIYDIAWSPSGDVLAIGDASGAVATIAAPQTYTPPPTYTPTPER